MASQTTNLHLTKPGLDDARDITILSGNFDIIDEDSGNKDTAINARALKTEAIKNITRSGATFTATRCDNTTFTFDQKDYSQISRGSSAGLAPGLPIGSGTTKYLREDGSWQVPPDTTYNDVTTSTHGLMTAADKTKLNGIANNANNYSLPLAANGTRGGVQVGYTQSGKNYPVQLSGEKMYVNVPWDNTTYNDATTSTHGLMSTADKTKLDGIAAGAQVNPGNATTSAAGLMSAADKTKLDKYKSMTKSNYGLKFKFFRNEAGQVTVTMQGTASSNISAGAAFNPGDAIASDYRPASSAWTNNGIKIDTSGYVWATDPIASGTTKVMSMVYGGND